MSGMALVCSRTPRRSARLRLQALSIASDPLRPPVLNTYNMRSNFTRVIQFLNGTVALNSTDLGSDSDNDWTDAAVVDAHVYAGFTYDYYFKRFGRRGLDNANVRILSLVHPVSRDNFFGASPALDDFYLNAAYYGSGVIVYGEGLPPALIFPTGAARELLRRCARRRGARAHAWRHRLLVAARICERVWRAERILLGRHGDQHRILFPAAWQSVCGRPTT